LKHDEPEKAAEAIFPYRALAKYRARLNLGVCHPKVTIPVGKARHDRSFRHG